MRRLVQRAEQLGSALPDYLLPADLSRHTTDWDPLKGERGFDPTRHQESWRTAWTKLRKVAGFPNLGFHHLRHLFITRMAEQGVPLQVTQAMVGHTTAEATARYTHISENAQRLAVEKLEATRKAPHFVDVFVDEPKGGEAKSLN
jgi:integrase